MARLFGKREGAWVNIPEDQVQEAYMSGLYAFATGTEVNVRLPDGRYGTISSEHAQDAFRAGAMYDQADVRQERIESAEYDQRNLEAGSLAVARGLSFGLSDVLAERLDLYSEEELAKLEKYNPNISLAGELTGAIAPALASGGTSLLAQGLSKGTVAGLSAKAGIAAEKAIAKRLGAGESVAGFEIAQKTVDKMIQGGAALTGAATVEGALFGAVDGFSEQMLGRADRTAEQMLSHVGGVTLLSGGLGGVLGLASPLIGKGLSAVNNSKFVRSVAEKAKEYEAKILKAMHGGDIETYKKLLDPKYAHTVVFRHGEVAGEVAEQTASFMNAAIDGLELATRSVSGSEKKRLMSEVIESDNPLGAIDETISVLFNALGTIRSAKAKNIIMESGELSALNKIEQGIRKQIDQIANTVSRKAAKEDIVVEVLAGQLRAIAKGSDELPNLSLKNTYPANSLLSPEAVNGALPELFIALDSLKRGVGKVVYGRAGSERIGNILESGNPLVDIYDALKNTLEDASLFGAKAATRQRETNRAFKRVLPSYHQFLRTFTREADKEGLGVAQRAATETEATAMATAESKALDEQIGILVDFRKRLKADRTYDLEDIRPRADDGFDEYRMRAEADVGTGIITKRVDEVANNIRTNVGDEAADAYEDAAKAQAQRNIDTRRGRDPNVSSPAASPGIPLIEKAFQRLDATIEAAKVHANTLDDGIESVVDYRKKLEVLNKKAGSLRGNLGRMKQGATPDAAKMEAIRKELNEVVEESIELTNARPGLGLDEAANREAFRKAVADHEEMGRALKIEEDKARAAVERAKKAKVKDPEALADLEEKLDNLIQRSVDHDNTPPLEKDYKITRDFGEEQRRGRTAKWESVKRLVNQAYEEDQATNFAIFREFIDNYEGFLKTLSREYDEGSLLTARKSQTVEGLQKSYESLKSRLDELGDIQRAYKQIYSVHSPMNTMLAALPVGGLLAGGIPGYLASGATSALVTPAAGFKRRAAIHGVKSLVASNLNKRATQVVNRIVKNTQPGAPQKARALPVLLALLGVKATGEPREDARLAMGAMSQLTEPGVLHARLESATEGLEEAPKIKEEVFFQMAKHINVLSDAASGSGEAIYDPVTGESEIYRSDADVSRFMSIAEISVGGTNVVADKVMRRTLTKSEGDAYRELYPNESEEFIETLLTKLAKSNKKISWDDRYALTKLTGIPMTNTLSPVFVGAMQSVHRVSVGNSSPRAGGNTLRKTGEASTTLVEQTMYG